VRKIAVRSPGLLSRELPSSGEFPLETVVHPVENVGAIRHARLGAIRLWGLGLGESGFRATFGGPDRFSCTDENLEESRIRVGCEVHDPARDLSAASAGSLSSLSAGTAVRAPFFWTFSRQRIPL